MIFSILIKCIELEFDSRMKLGKSADLTSEQSLELGDP